MNAKLEPKGKSPESAKASPETDSKGESGGAKEPKKPIKSEPSLKELRRRRRNRLLARLMLWVGAPTVAASVYYLGIASDQFESTAQFAVHSSDRVTPVGLEVLMGASGGGASAHDTLSVRDYVLSRDVLARLDQEHGFYDHYSSPERDFWARLPKDADSEERFEYYLSMIDVEHDTLSGNLSLHVRAFTPEAAKTFSTAIIGYSEEMVNRMSERAREDQIAFALRQVAQAEERLRASSRAISDLQTQRGEFDPQQTAAAVVGIRSELEIELAKARAELSQLQAIYQPKAAKVLEAQRRVAALKGQIARENERLVASEPADENGPPDQSLSQSLVAFQQASLEQEFARAAYHSSLTSLETSRAQANQQQRYLTPIAEPSQPDAATHPEKALGILTVFFVSFAAFGIFGLLGASIREHARL